ncbi:MAG: hypothetical protein AABX48_01805 [Nanoarchaeota archaeon]
MAKRVSNNERHVRWNWEISPEFDDDNRRVRYHFVIVDDKDRRGTLNKLLGELAKFRGNLTPVRTVEGSVTNTRFRYLFCSYDSSVKSSEINFSRLKRLVKKDSGLYERKVGNIEDYVANIYGR